MLGTPTRILLQTDIEKQGDSIDAEAGWRSCAAA